MTVARLLLLFLVAMNVTGCDLHVRSSRYASAEPMTIQRFDRSLFAYIESGDTTLRNALVRDYPAMLDLVGKGILNIKNIDTPGFFDKLMAYYSNPELKKVYRDALASFNDVTAIEKQLGQGFAYLQDHFPAMPLPAVYMHVSGFNQNVLTGAQTLSLSTDKYLGYDYPLYEQFFYDYQRIKMQPEDVAPDYLTGWLMSEFPFTGKENVLLERMIYNGKIKYLVSHAFPEIEKKELLGYNPEQLLFMEANEGLIWQTIIERKHLYTPDHITTGQYFEEQPAQFIADNAPGNIGTYIGWQIVEKYMKETNSTPGQLMQQTNAQELLTASRYRP